MSTEAFLQLASMQGLLPQSRARQQVLYTSADGTLHNAHDCRSKQRLQIGMTLVLGLDSRVPRVQEAGRQAVLEAGGVLPLTTLLQVPEPQVHARAAGALHNLSSHPEAIRIIRMADAIPRLTDLLR